MSKIIGHGTARRGDKYGLIKSLLGSVCLQIVLSVACYSRDPVPLYYDGYSVVYDDTEAVFMARLARPVDFSIVDEYGRLRDQVVWHIYAEDDAHIGYLSTSTPSGQVLMYEDSGMTPYPIFTEYNSESNVLRACLQLNTLESAGGAVPFDYEILLASYGAVTSYDANRAMHLVPEPDYLTYTLVAIATIAISFFCSRACTCKCPEEELTSRAERQVHLERMRQKLRGYDAAHDDGHDNSELALNAAILAVYELYPDFAVVQDFTTVLRDDSFECSKKWAGDSQTCQRQRLIIAAALLIAEVERLDRLWAGPLLKDDGPALDDGAV